MNPHTASPLVTIGIPCFNAAPWIAKAIQSALDQDWPQGEIMVVDDGSTDNSRKIIESFNVRLIAQERLGGNVARNVILQEAQGEWIQFLDADDYLLPDKIRYQLDAISTQAEVIYSPVLEEVDEKLQEIRVNKSMDIYAQWIAWRVAQTGSVLWKKTALEKVGGWNEQMSCCQDNEMCLRALKAGLNFVYKPEAKAVYRTWEEHTVSKKDPMHLIETKTKLIDDMLDWLRKENRFTKMHLKTAGQAFFEMARTLFKYNEMQAVEYFRKRKNKNLIKMHGPTAPHSYRIVYIVLGFQRTEKLAHFLRN